MEEALDEKIKWLEANQEAEVEEFTRQKKELEDVIQPIVSKLYADGAPPTHESSDDEGKDEL